MTLNEKRRVLARLHVRAAELAATDTAGMSWHEVAMLTVQAAQLAALIHQVRAARCDTLSPRYDRWLSDNFLAEEP